MSNGIFKRHKYPISPMEALVLLRNIEKCPDAENDADRTVEEICSEIDSFDGKVSKSLLESALYCSNMESEAGKFWHPFGWTFKRFVEELLPKNTTFDMYYNQINEVVHEPVTKTRR